MNEIKIIKKAEVYLENGKCVLFEYNEMSSEQIEKAYFFGIRKDTKYINTAIIPHTYLIIFLD